MTAHLLIRALNDELRTRGQGGQTMITRGVAALGEATVLKIRAAVARYDAFDEGNDPYGEHDFGSITVDGVRVFWKIDYYDPSLSAGSSDPSDAGRTRRVLTIMLAEEY